MKRKHCIILLLLSLNLVTQAQIIITTPYELSIGASGGATFSSVTFSPLVQQNKKTGVTIGLTGRITMGQFVGLQLELNFAQQGWKENFEYPEETTEGETNPSPHIEYYYNRLLNYVQLPFYTHIQFGSKNVKGFINAGPQIGFMTSESTKSNLDGGQPGRVNMQHNMPVQKKFDWGISGGGGIEIRTGIGYFLIEGRYMYALGDIYNSRREDPFSKASCQTISVKMTYLLPFK